MSYELGPAAPTHAEVRDQPGALRPAGVEGVPGYLDLTAVRGTGD